MMIFQRTTASIIYIVLLLPYLMTRKKRPKRHITFFKESPHLNISYDYYKIFKREHVLYILNHWDILRLVILGRSSLIGVSESLAEQKNNHKKFGIINRRLLNTLSGVITYNHDEPDIKLINLISFPIILFALLLFFKKPKKRYSIMTIYNVKINNITFNKLIHGLKNILTKNIECQRVFFVNAECINISQKDPEYCRILNSSYLTLPDGSGIRLAARYSKNQHIINNLNGTDLFLPLLAMAEKEQASVYFLGAKPGTTDKVCEWARQLFPKLIIAGHHHGYVDNWSPILADINRLQAKILFVGLGAPQQEKWLEKYQHSLPCKLAFGVGGLFDYYSGNVKRAPLGLRNVGMEWIYRFYQEPFRLGKRYTHGNINFLYNLWKEKHIYYHLTKEDNRLILTLKRNLNNTQKGKLINQLKHSQEEKILINFNELEEANKETILVILSVLESLQKNFIISIRCNNDYTNEIIELTGLSNILSINAE
jgi:exopolysaccharide biosynthesis WecB/TagA/CpsF family protein